GTEKPLADFYDLDPAQDPERRRPFDLVAGLVAEQRAAERRFVRDPALEWVGLGRADDGVALVARVGAHLDVGSDLDHALGAVAVLDEDRLPEHALQGLDAALNQALLVLSLRVLGILGDVAEVTGSPDPLGHLHPAHADQLLQLFLELAQAFL